jgi:hypothetical protein
LQCLTPRFVSHLQSLKPPARTHTHMFIRTHTRIHTSIDGTYWPLRHVVLTVKGLYFAQVNNDKYLGFVLECVCVCV